MNYETTVTVDHHLDFGYQMETPEERSRVLKLIIAVSIATTLPMFILMGYLLIWQVRLF